MHALLYDLRELCKHNKDGSYRTQADRIDMLAQMGDQLVAMGFWQLRAREIGRRHVHRLFALWQQQGIDNDTQLNRAAALRWWCSKVHRASVMPRTNAELGLRPRRRVAVESKAWVLTDDILIQVEDPCIRLSFELQREFGLRRKECLLLRPWRADHGDVLTLQGSWCKNGRPRELELRWPEQREVLDRAKAFVRLKSASLIPRDLRYYQQRNRYDAWAKKLGLEPLHGLRHHFAQKLFASLAGFSCPLDGGPTRAQMTPEQRATDRVVRQQVSAELGHGRVSIVGMYCGV